MKVVNKVRKVKKGSAPKVGTGKQSTSEMVSKLIESSNKDKVEKAKVKRLGAMSKSKPLSVEESRTESKAGSVAVKSKKNKEGSKGEGKRGSKGPRLTTTREEMAKVFGLV